MTNSKMVVPGRQHPQRIAHGVSLIEVLVSILLVTLGVLGASAMQTVALRNNQSSYEGTQSSILVQGLLDAMRSNAAGVTAGNYNTSGWLCTAPTATTLPARDMARWINALHDQMNAAACGRVTCAATTGSAGSNTCTVSVRWNDARTASGSAGRTVETQVQL
jgi:type IV pilus assembly protein PilV